MVVNEKYPIRPEMIDTYRCFNAFEDLKTNAAARYVVKYAQRVGDWRLFRENDINLHSDCIALLLEKRLLFELVGGYRATHDLVARAFLHNPVPYIGFMEDWRYCNTHRGYKKQGISDARGGYK